MTAIHMPYRVFPVHDTTVMNTGTHLAVNVQTQGDLPLMLMFQQAVIQQWVEALENMVEGKKPKTIIHDADGVKIKFKRRGFSLHDDRNVHERQLTGADQFVMTDKAITALIEQLNRPLATETKEN